MVEVDRPRLLAMPHPPAMTCLPAYRAIVVSEDEDHVKVLGLEVDALKVDALHLLQVEDKGRLAHACRYQYWAGLGLCCSDTPALSG